MGAMSEWVCAAVVLIAVAEEERDGRWGAVHVPFPLDHFFFAFPFPATGAMLS